MYWIGTGLLLLGAICGATLRLLTFVLVLMAAAAVSVAIWQNGPLQAFLFAGAAVTILLIGYVLGISMRAAVRALRNAGGRR